MENTTTRRSPIVRFFSRSSNAFITAAATIIAAVISVYGVRQHAEVKVSQAEKELEVTRKLLRDATAQIELLRSGNETTDTAGTTEATANGGSTSAANLYASNPIATNEAQNFDIRLYRCRREGGAVRCYFAVTNKQAERALQIAGYPGDNRYSRAYDDQGQLHTAEIPEISGVTGNEVSMPEGVTLRVVLTFKTVPSSVRQFSVVKFVFHHAYNTHSADFRDITIT